jgi:hypothetical protein
MRLANPSQFLLVNILSWSRGFIADLWDPETFDDLIHYFKYASSAYSPVCMRPNGNTLVLQVCKALKSDGSQLNSSVNAVWKPLERCPRLYRAR